MYLGLKMETPFAPWVFIAHKSPEGGCGKDRMVGILAEQCAALEASVKSRRDCC